MLNKEELATIRLALNQMLDADNVASERQLSNQQRADAIRATGYIEDLLMGDMIASYWTIDDVLALASGEIDGRKPVDINETRAREVLQRAEEKHDANEGITWDVLRYHLSNATSKKEV